MRFDVFSAVRVQIVVFWVVTLYDIVGGYQSFGRIYCHHLQGNDFCSEDGGRMSLRDVGNHLQDHTVLQPKRLQCEKVKFLIV
jgi:hypothetical protein